MTALVAILAVDPPSAFAQNHRELAIGGRTATMGGAATAAGNDSAMPYLNPAGLAGVPGDIFAVSATVYSHTYRSFRDYFYPNGTQPLLGYQKDSETFSTSSVSELPSSVMYFNQPSDPNAKIQHRVGISLVIPSARRVDLVASVRGRLANVSGTALETSSLNALQTRYYVGPSYAVGVGKDLRFGASFYGVYYRRIVSFGSTSSFTILGGSTTSSFTGQNSQIADGLSIAPILGAQARVVSDLWVGLGVAAPSVPITGRSRLASNSSGVVPDPTTGSPRATSETSAADTSFEAVTPLRVNAGVAWDRRESFSAAFDVHLYTSRSYTEVNGAQTFESQRSGDLTRQFTRSIVARARTTTAVDFSLGAEYAFRRGFAVRAGGFTDVASTPELTSSINDDLYRIRLDRYGGTLGLGMKLGSFDTTAGVVLVHGTGRFGAADTWITGDVVPVRTTETTTMLVLSGAVTTAEAKKTIQETLPFNTPPLPDLERPGEVGTPAPWIPSPLPPEPKPPPPSLGQPPSQPSPSSPAAPSSATPSSAPASSSLPAPAPTPAAPARLPAPPKPQPARPPNVLPPPPEPTP